MNKSYTLLFCLLTFTSLSFAQIQINEYSASNLTSYEDFFGKTEDWIELYNSSTSAVDIGGWHLSDKESKPQKWEIPMGTMIPANGHLVFLCSGRDRVINGEIHTNFKLTQTKTNEFVVLSDVSGIILEAYPLALTLVEHSRARVTDGSQEWGVATNPTFGMSNNITSSFTGYTQAPTMDLAAGFYSNNQTVNITNNEPNSTLRYTINGTNPIESSAEYTGPIPINNTQVIKAQAFSNDPLILPGKMDFNTYFINENFSLAVYSVAADEVIELANGNGDLIPIGSLEYFNTEKELEATSFGSLNRHGQDSWVLNHRSIDWVSRDEMGYSKAVDAPLFSYSERDEYQKFMFRNSGDDNYPAINDDDHDGSTHIRDEYVQTLAQNGDMELDLRAVERVILFLNGQYWGVYGMRERPVDHDYTDEYYDQGKYDLQYLTTWGETEIQYGGQRAVNEWIDLRNFILENDMSDSANYQLAEDSINMVSLIDYMIVNLNVVASDWLNYNTGWWRGRNPEGKHKKWGYILWDLDATFDYYLNYSGVPNISPNAEPCDLEEIGEFMDEFFSDGSGGDPNNCTTIQNGSSPYAANDSFFVQTIQSDSYCCDTDWDETCQDIYNDLTAGGGSPGDCTTIQNGSSPYPANDPFFVETINTYSFCCDSSWNVDCQSLYNLFEANGGGGGPTINGDVGQHEKVFLKLLAENPTFKQLYYSRYADMMNTVFSCENMIATLDTMLAVIRPEMPRQIARWGGSMSEWESNVEDLKDFINQRCTLLDDGALECYEELSGPHRLTLLTEPNGIGEIDLNTLDIEAFPWSGDYFAGMDQKIKAKVFNDFADDYEFSHWESSASNIFFPSENDRKAWITITQPDTLTAVFRLIGSVATTDMAADLAMRVFPNPTSDQLTLTYELEQSAEVAVKLVSTIGQEVMSFPQAGGFRSTGNYQINLPLDQNQVSSGLYFLIVRVGERQQSFKVSVLRL